MVLQKNIMTSQSETLESQLLEAEKVNDLQLTNLLDKANSDLMAQIYDCQDQTEIPAPRSTDRCISVSHPDKRVQALSVYLEMSRSLTAPDRSTSLTLYKPDLSNMDLSGLDLNDTHLEGADFTGSNLVRLDLRTVGGNQMILVKSELRGTALGVVTEIESNRNLFGFDLSQAYADAIEPDQTCKDADCANLINQAATCKAWFENLTLESSTFTKARLRHSSFQLTSASNVSFRDAQMQCVDLRNVQFLENVDLRDADLSGAWLYGADLSGAKNLEPHQLERTCGAAVILPEGIDPPIHWKELPWDPLLDEGVPEGCPPGDDLLARNCLRWQPHRARYLDRHQSPLSQYQCKHLLQRKIP